MRELKVLDVGRVAAFVNRDNVIDARRERVRKLVGEIDRSPADSADCLRRIDLLLVCFECSLMITIVVRAFHSHGLYQPTILPSSNTKRMPSRST